MASQVLSLRALNRATLARQLLLGRADLPVADAVGRLASLQAQHPDWPKIGLWSRVSGLEPGALEAAIRRREVVRGTLMRTTLHIVRAADYWPFSTITLPGRQDQFRIIFKEAADDPLLMKRLRPAHEAALAALAERPRSKAELRDILADAVPDAAKREHDYLWRHFISVVPLVDVPPSRGASRYGRSLYAAAADWLGPPRADSADRQKAITLLVERYLAAYGPASRDDIVAWAGRLAVSQLKPAIAALEDRLVTFTDEAGRELMDLADAPRPGARTSAPVRFLTRWDSALLSHHGKWRTRILPAEYHAVVNKPNGDVLPTFLLDGFVAGTWRYERAKRNASAALELGPLRRLSAGEKRDLLAEGGELAGFLDLGAVADVRVIED